MRSKKKLIAAASSVCFAAMMSLTAYASGDVAGAVTSTWGAAKSHIFHHVFLPTSNERMNCRRKSDRQKYKYSFDNLIRAFGKVFLLRIIRYFVFLNVFSPDKLPV